MPTNPTADYKQYVLANLPSGVTVSPSDGFFVYNGHKFPTFLQCKWYRGYVIKYGFSPDFIPKTATLGFSAHSFLAQAVDNIADQGDPFFMNNWQGNYQMNFLPFSSLKERWDNNGLDRTGNYNGALWVTEFSNPYDGAWPLPSTTRGIEFLQYLYWYALTAQNKGCKAFYIFPPWSPGSVDASLDSNTMSTAKFWQDWLRNRSDITIPVYIMPVPVIVRRIRQYLSPVSPFKDGDDLHLSNSINSTPLTYTMASIGAGIIMMMTRKKLVVGSQMTALVDIVWNTISEYQCTGLGGSTAVTPIATGNPLPNPTPLP